MRARASAKRVAPGEQEPLAVSTESAKISMLIIPLFQSFTFITLYQGRRASLRSALAPGSHISRLWRWQIEFDS
jgi:hypothetical protein